MNAQKSFPEIRGFVFLGAQVPLAVVVLVPIVDSSQIEFSKYHQCSLWWERELNSVLLKS